MYVEAVHTIRSLVYRLYTRVYTRVISLVRPDAATRIRCRYTGSQSAGICARFLWSWLYRERATCPQSVSFYNNSSFLPDITWCECMHCPLKDAYNSKFKVMSTLMIFPRVGLLESLVFTRYIACHVLTLSGDIVNHCMNTEYKMDWANKRH